MAEKDMMILGEDGCPDVESVLAVVEGAEVPPAKAGGILYHLSTCAKCREAVSFICAAIVAEKRRCLAETAPCWRRVISTIDDWARWAAGEDSAADDIALAAAAPKRALVFQSRAQQDGVFAWCAEVSFPTPEGAQGKGAGGLLRVVVRDGRGNPLCGRFRLFGVECSIGVKDGEVGGTLSFAEVLARMKRSQGDVAFAEAEGAFTEGVPVLGSILSVRGSIS